MTMDIGSVEPAEGGDHSRRYAAEDAMHPAMQIVVMPSLQNLRVEDVLPSVLGSDCSQSANS